MCKVQNKLFTRPGQTRLVFEGYAAILAVLKALFAISFDITRLSGAISTAILCRKDYIHLKQQAANPTCPINNCDKCHYTAV